MTPDLATELERLALAVQFLSVSRKDPEAFHIERSEIVHALRGLAQRGEHGGRRWWRSDRRRPVEV